ncbi:putative membrane protein [Lachnellula subtilissima]|uniref:Putative membrane protein n=1 Tax=Lachnellula subtilissima TaxID=602034 RepID=A0A8H8S3D9_9HELO|nr:putative membrane protein [Lachnellula subtilissima]
MTRKSRGPAKLPTKQLAILAICRFAEPVALTSVFPYLPEMIEGFGVKEEKVAKWAGITSAAFSLSQCSTAIIWGRASDMFGRKPVILFGLTCTMICTLLWGMSTSLPMAIMVRALAGACNGNVGIIRTMVAEMVPEKELQPRAFSIMPLVWSLGSIFGPSFGGFFAKPAENFPGIFGNSKFLIKFPFLLPNIVASALFTVGISTGILFLRETLETKRHKTDYGREVGARLVSAFKTTFRLNRKHKTFGRHSNLNEEQSASLLRPTSSAGNEQYDGNFSSKSISKPPQPAPALREVFTRQSVINLIAYTLLALHAVAYDQLLPIFMHAKKQPHDANTQLPFKFTGGFGINHARIGVLFTAYGFVGCFIQFLVFPPMARRFGVLNCFKCCAVAFPLICFVTPYTALIQSSTLQQAAMFAIMVVRSFAVIFAFPCSIILLTNSAVSLRILGTLNGVAVSVSAVGRAIGPALGGTAFTWGVERGYVITPWWLLGGIAMIGAIPIWHLVEMEGFNKAPEDNDDEDDDEEGLLDQVDEENSLDILEGDEVFDDYEEALDVVDGSSLSRVLSKKSTASGTSAFERRLSSPIGIRESVGPGGGRRLSNGLAASNMGQGTGGTSFV